MVVLLQDDLVDSCKAGDDVVSRRAMRFGAASATGYGVTNAMVSCSGRERTGKLGRPP